MPYGKYIVGDSKNVLEELFDEHGEFVDLVITSPPYNMNKDYDNYNDSLKPYEYYTEMCGVFNQVRRVLKPDGRLAINIPMHIPSLNGNVMMFFNEVLKACDLNLYTYIVWIKSSMGEQVFTGNNTGWGSWKSASSPAIRSYGELILFAYKSQWKKLNRGESDISKEEFMEYTKNVWYFPTTKSPHHPATFPNELPYRCMKLLSYVGDTILDPFVGLGSTLDVANELNRESIGIDLSQKYKDVYSK